MAEFFSVPEGVSDKQQLGGVAYLRGINIATAKNGSKYAAGILATKEGEYPFKKWSTESLDAGVYELSGAWNVYNGSGSVIINTAVPVKEGEGFSKQDFLQSRYNPRGLLHDFQVLVKNNVSEKGCKLFNMLLAGRGGKDQEFVKRFCNEFAACTHHDAVLGGLIAHSYKTAEFLVAVINSPIRVFRDMSQDFKDIVIVGGALHDLGKVYEYKLGEMSDMGKFISHRTFAVMRATELKDDIIALYGEEGFVKLVSIFSQHHGEFEETPRTVEALLVHYADNFDAQVTTLDEGVQKLQQGDDSVRAGDFRVSL